MLPAVAVNAIFGKNAARAALMFALAAFNACSACTMSGGGWQQERTPAPMSANIDSSSKARAGGRSWGIRRAEHRRAGCCGPGRPARRYDSEACLRARERVLRLLHVEKRCVAELLHAPGHVVGGLIRLHRVFGQLQQAFVGERGQVVGRHRRDQADLRRFAAMRLSARSCSSAWRFELRRRPKKSTSHEVVPTPRHRSNLQWRLASARGSSCRFR